MRKLLKWGLAVCAVLLLTVLVLHNRSPWLSRIISRNTFGLELWPLQKANLKIARYFDRKNGEVSFFLALGYSNAEKRNDISYRYYKEAITAKYPLTRVDVFMSLAASQGKCDEAVSTLQVTGYNPTEINEAYSKQCKKNGKA